MREIYLELLNKHKDNDTLDVKVAKELVNKIYDDFESRTCVNCKHSRTTDNYTNVWCESGGTLDDVNTSREFRCSDWVSKND